jgi:GT2 family glycosyltransferase
VARPRRILFIKEEESSLMGEIVCDLVLLSWNNLALLKNCVESIIRHTDVPSHLIIVDNNSGEKGIKEYLKELNPSGKVREIILLENADNLGYSKGMNIGLRYALEHFGSPYQCLLNNDIIVTPHWLSEMITAAEKDPKNGMVNPESNTFNTYLPRREHLDQFASRNHQFRNGQWTELGSGIGFCLLIKRPLLEKIGLLDEGFGMGYYEDADFSKRAQKEGYRCILALGAYVYHYGGVSFGKHPQRSSLFLKNEEIFYSRWKMNKPGRIGYVLSGDNRSDFVELSRQIRQSANQFNKVWILCRQREFKKNLPNHWNVKTVLYSGPRFLFLYWSFGYLALKKKKMNRLFVDDRRLAGLFDRYHQRHQAEIRVIQ